MATTTTVAAAAASSASKNNAPRRRRLIGALRRVEDDESGDRPGLDLVDDDSLSEGSAVSDDNDSAGGSDTSNIDEASPTIPVVYNGSSGTGPAKGARNKRASTSGKRTASPQKADTDADMAADGTVAKMNDLSISDQNTATSGEPPSAHDAEKSKQETEMTDAAASSPASAPIQASQSTSTNDAPRPTQPAIVSSSSVQMPRRETAYERQRREHDLYRQKRDEDPAFVPNRGAFFMHDHRGAGPAANGFRPFGRQSRGRGRGGFGAPFSPLHNQYQGPPDPIVSAPWAHDMHDVVAQPNSSRMAAARRQNIDARSQYGGSQAAMTTTSIPTCPPSATPINRSMSVEKPLGTLTVRVFFPPMKAPVLFEKFKVVQYTKLPDHRPPLRRDKAVVINLPGHRKSHINPALDRSFIFIPRALRPNQRMRGRGAQSVLGSISGFSRRTSVFGGSYYNGSMYSPSVALSRRSSNAPEIGRDFIIPPSGSAISRPPLALENAPRPIVRLPPSAASMVPPSVAEGGYGHGHGYGMPGGPASFLPPPPPSQQQQQQQQQHQYQSAVPNLPSSADGANSSHVALPQHVPETSLLSHVPPPQNHPLPQRPSFHDSALPMHQPRPQKAVSVNTIEPSTSMHRPPAAVPSPFAMPFHQQVPIQLGNGYQPTEGHSRHPSYPSHSTGTPLSQIPERAIHAAPFHPTQQQSPYGQPNPMAPVGATFYSSPNNLPMMQHPQQNYYYAPGPTYLPNVAGTPSAAAPAFVPGGALPQNMQPFGQPMQSESGGAGVNGPQSAGGRNLVAQQHNGMVYYYDPSQVQTGVPGYQSYATPPPPQGGFMPGMPGMVTPNSVDGYYYPPQSGAVYFQQ